MLISFVDTLLSLLSLIGVPLLLFIGFLLFSNTKRGTLKRLRRDVMRDGLWFAFTIALIATLGSLFYSEIAHYTPCKLCWLQRIFMYPLTLTLLIAAIRKDKDAWYYVVPQVLIGAAIALGHYLLQLSQRTGVCVADAVDCAQSYTFFAGFISIPFMALTGFLLILVFVLLSRKKG